ncbi:hypothetical protein ACIBL6_09120 [Streptomyces sp. NPDC050400]|uniref:DUF7848 domain-containing protein n=1 Tax=Streptomyces sp. NPDC050400 TaxID=3365610 RepID=UPI0037B16683
MEVDVACKHCPATSGYVNLESDDAEAWARKHASTAGHTRFAYRLTSHWRAEDLDNVVATYPLTELPPAPCEVVTPPECGVRERVPEPIVESLRVICGHDLRDVFVECWRELGHPPDGHTGPLLELGVLHWDTSEGPASSSSV